ncbi:AMP-binding protein [Streptomyces sp. NPDC047515]|uniref:AMP-binding protein n=1 Tax=Streptomyces sp. NPDC047515 TaxID=3155380 RepID=UPI0034003818
MRLLPPRPLTTCAEFFDAWFGAARTGAVMVPTNPLSTPDKLAYILGHSDCRSSLTLPDLLATVQEAAKTTPGYARPLVPGIDEFPSARDAATPPDAPRPDNAGVPHSALYTSGTPSRPKGVLVTHAAHLHSVVGLVTCAPIALVPRFSASRWAAQAAALEATGGQRPRPDFEQLHFDSSWGNGIRRDPAVVDELTAAGVFQRPAPLPHRRAGVHRRRPCAPWGRVVAGLVAGGHHTPYADRPASRPTSRRRMDGGPRR